MPRALILLAQGCEELEAVTLIDLLRRAGIEVVSASLDEQRQVTASRGVCLLADSTLAGVNNAVFDMLILPGGADGARHLKADPQVRTLIQQQLEQGRDIAAICAAPTVLAAMGILNGRNATCYPGFIDPAEYPEISLHEDAVVIDGNILTSRGPGTAMDFALTIIETLTDIHTRQTVEKALVRPL